MDVLGAERQLGDGDELPGAVERPHAADARRHREPASTKASLTFTPPSGAKVRDFFLTRWIYYYNPTLDGSGTAPPYILYSFGNTAFAGAGEYDAATRDAINATGHWYGYPSGALDTGAAEVTKATFGRLTGHR